MNRKLLTIQVLKDRINNMQRDIQRLQATKPSRTPKKQRQLTPKNQTSVQSRNTSSNKRYKSPTFWTGNTLIGQENPYLSNFQSLSPSSHKRRRSVSRSKSPVIQKISKNVDEKFYRSIPVDRSQGKENCCSTCKDQQKATGNLFTAGGNNYNKKDMKASFFMMPRPIRTQKKRTFYLEQKDPINNPQPSKPSRKKIVKKQPRAPENMYTENPMSNPELYFSTQSSQPVTMSPKAHNNRNLSPHIKLLLSNSAEDLTKFKQSTPKSNKKHYGRYYQDNLISKWRTNW